jgi:signal transduction histidine kinase
LVTITVVVMRWDEVRDRFPGWAADALIIFLAVDPLPAQFASGRYPVSHLASALLFLVLLARRRFPAAAIIVAFSGALVLAALPPPAGGNTPVALFGRTLVLFAIAGTIRPEWAAWTGWALGVGFIGVTELTGRPRADYGWADFFLTSAVCSVIFGGMLLASRPIRAHREMARRARQAEADRERSAAQAAAAERARITREMHDVVAHSLTVAVVQCVAAADDLDSGSADSAAVRRRVRAAEGACRDALDELRRMLGVLRYGSESLAPTPRLAELPDLARAIGAAGVRVEMNLDGDLDGLPPGVELSCYRIVQEALTNTLKHSGARIAHVSVSGLVSDIRVRVNDDGPGGGGITRPGGHGLIGMRERAAAYGGTLSAGPQPAGGYLVEAVLPRGERR